MVRVGDNINMRQFPSQFSSSIFQAQSTRNIAVWLALSLLAVQSDLPQLLWSLCLQTMLTLKEDPSNCMKARWGICPMPAASSR